MSGRIDHTRDHPLSRHWRPIDPDAFHALRLPPARSRAAAITRAQIIPEAFVVGRADPTVWISYSRRRAFYTGRERYWPPKFMVLLSAAPVAILHAPQELIRDFLIAGAKTVGGLP